MTELERDTYFMKKALAEAEKAQAIGEVPIGALIVQGDDVVGYGYNLRERDNDPTAHAEVVALRDAARRLNSWRLTNCTLYVTIEPCPMCAGALVMARVERLVYGAADPKAGAVDSLFDIVREPRLNHRLDVTAGVLQQECAALMQAFFRRLRGK